MLKLTLNLGERSYPIFIGDGLLKDAELIRRQVSGHQVAIITNTTVAPLYLEPVQSALQGLQVDVYQCPDGEIYKSLDQYSAIIDWLIQRRHNRSTTVIALGGGVVGDLAGFVAATYQRGVGFIQIPTTLLAQVDSSVGGKTAVNHAAGKNLIGAFYQPSSVVADCTVFNTLPEREFLAGLAEVVKYGVIADIDFFEWLESNQAGLLNRQSDLLILAVKRSCELKAAVVAEDERENGRRAILNFGHTFGHALEQTLGYGVLLHGEAVSVGMVLAARYSEAFGKLPKNSADRIERLLRQLGLPVTIPESPTGPLTAQALITAMGMDKKVQDGRVRLVLSNRLGHASLVDQADVDVLKPFLMEQLKVNHG